MDLRAGDRSRLRGHDYLWWAMGAALGLCSMWAPDGLRGLVDARTAPYFIFSGLFVCGVFLGFFRHDRAWRWGVACLIAIPLGDLAWAANDPRVSLATPELLFPYFASQFPAYVLRALPVFLGAYLGAFLAAGQDIF